MPRMSDIVYGARHGRTVYLRRDGRDGHQLSIGICDTPPAFDAAVNFNRCE